MKISQIIRTLTAGLFFLALSCRVSAYLMTGLEWDFGSDVVMHLGLGPAAVPLQDGSASWNDSAADALKIWNGYLDFISLTSVSSTSVPQVSGDGVNSVFFSSTVFGDSFGDGTLAVTVVLPGAGYAVAEADVVVNTAYHFDSYRGPLQAGVYDFHRVVLHEFGHVLGLSHVTNDAPGTTIMAPVISDFDHEGSDDVLGLRNTYGALLRNVGDLLISRVGDPVLIDTHQFYPNNNPTSYEVTGLPPGLVFDPTVGEVTGVPTEGGDYRPVVTAHGAFGDAYAAMPIKVLGLDRVQGLLSILHLPTSSIVADPIRPRLYVAGSDGINMIETNSFAVTNLVSGDKSHAQLSVSADGSLLLYTDSTQLSPLMNRIDLDSLVASTAVHIPANTSPVVEGLENRDYVSDKTGVFQFDRTTGHLQTSFALTDSDFNFINISADRATLFVAQFASGYLLTYDVSGADPVLTQSIPGDFRLIVPSPDGQYLYTTLGDSGPSGDLFQGHLPDLNPLTPFAISSLPSQVAVSPDGSIYEAVNWEGSSTLGSFQIYDSLSLQQKFDIDLTDWGYQPYASMLPNRAAFDNSGKYLFVAVNGGLPGEVWVFSTDLASFPPPSDPSKNLLNISTRARVETDEDAMIGGFIVNGSDPKEVLVRCLGPSLPVTGVLANPLLELRDSSGALITSNDSWTSNRLKVVGTSLAPSSEREAAILATLQPGAYTTIVRDATNQPGVALLEIYDLDPKSSLLANISTRGKVETGDNVMIGGFVIGGTEPTNVLIRAIGPSLTSSGIEHPLANPMLELHNSSGKLISSNDNWRSDQAAAITATGLAPTNNFESAIIATLDPGSYTAIVRGENDSTGVALVEVYNLDAVTSASH